MNVVSQMERKLSEAYRQEIAERIRLKSEELVNHEVNPPAEKPKPPESAPDAVSSALRVNDQLIAQTGVEIAALEVERQGLAGLLETIEAGETGNRKGRRGTDWS